MRNLLKFIIKNHFGLVFIVLEILALILLFQNSNFHKAKYLDIVQRINASFHQFNFKVKKYVNLIQENERLLNENIRLRHQIANNHFEIITKFPKLIDTVFIDQYDFIAAKVINNSVNKQYNYITLNKGSKDGIEPEMAVISPDGVVGKVIKTSNNFSLVISLLNRDFMISSKIKNSNYFGPVSWEGDNYRKAYLNEIPFHVKPDIGDTIVTSGYSSSFPENIPLGLVESYKLERGNFNKISITLVTDFKNLSNVYLIKDNYKEEIETLESSE